MAHCWPGRWEADNRGEERRGQRDNYAAMKAELGRKANTDTGWQWWQLFVETQEWRLGPRLLWRGCKHPSWHGGGTMKIWATFASTQIVGVSGINTGQVLILDKPHLLLLCLSPLLTSHLFLHVLIRVSHIFIVYWSESLKSALWKMRAVILCKSQLDQGVKRVINTPISSI